LASEANGFYEDHWIDLVAKRLLPVLRDWLARGRTLFDPEFVATYLHVVHDAFPTGLPPVVFLRPFACATESELAKATDHLVAVSGAPFTMCSSDADEAREIVASHTAWGTAILVTKPGLTQLADRGLLDAAMVARVRAQRFPFVLTARRAPIGVTFVFAATDEPEMIRLIDAFAARTEPLADGVFTP
jgi:hypothetical protein